VSEPQKQNGRRRIGRPPREPLPAERFAISIRITPDLKRRIAIECESNGRSQSHEIEMRLERSFWLDDMLKARLLSARMPAGQSETEG
jgi:hypothetical protein